MQKKLLTEHNEEKFEDTQRVIRSVICRRTENTMANRRKTKWQKHIYKTENTTQKTLKIEHDETLYNSVSVTHRVHT
jgi:hypothetical protein